MIEDTTEVQWYRCRACGHDFCVSQTLERAKIFDGMICPKCGSEIVYKRPRP